MPLQPSHKDGMCHIGLGHPTPKKLSKMKAKERLWPHCPLWQVCRVLLTASKCECRTCRRRLCSHAHNRADTARVCVCATGRDTDGTDRSPSPMTATPTACRISLSSSLSMSSVILLSSNTSAYDSACVSGTPAASKNASQLHPPPLPVAAPAMADNRQALTNQMSLKKKRHCAGSVS